MGLMQGLSQMMLQQRGHLFGWVPVCLACGIGCYFTLTFEPALPVLIGLGTGAWMLIWAQRFLPETISPLVVALALGLIGFDLAALRAHAVGGPVLGWRYYGAIEGRIVGIDRSQSDALRLTLDRVVLDRVSRARTPARVRVSLHGDQSHSIAAEPGLRVMTTGHLSPPSGPVEPGGFDFQRHAWFARLGAVGYTRTPVLGVAVASHGRAGLLVLRVRMAASARVQAALEGDIGGFATAITTGDRSAISQTALFDLRASNLAHLLAISGLHMGLLSAVVFGALRLVLSLIPWVALRWPTRSIAAAGALIAATGYLALSGGNVATERAFVMVAVALGALMLGRRALSLRAVAIAATIVLTLRPEALMGPGFQMSFAATTALVAVFGWLREADLSLGPKWLAPAVATFISSAVAGLFTAPVGAAHFNSIAHFGLIANLLSVPLMGLLVMPAAVAALVMAPLGLDHLPLWIMGLGLRWILGVAAFVADLDGARGHVKGPGVWVLPLMALGFLWLLLWQGRLRFAGIAAVVWAFVLWHQAARPAVLIADSGNLVGIMTAQGRALSKAKGAGFVARNWLENDGDGVEQEEAAARWGPSMRIGGQEIIHLSGKRAAAAFGGCTAGQIVVSSVKIDRNIGDCVILDPAHLRKTGAIAMSINNGQLEMQTARQMAGTRLWTQWPDR
ncbi:competence protein ComEC [Sulfitobacter marinus]|uniref:Competence protein ComEC n=1 Tax=Sulfitobacter marinus TaxID=394264 RepID=A0A1I6SE49_9RHOB|nr:ComEC/Rec2 family competence protein [Sulfitobacter marinus]SFS75110.1 competence protein ComEC [Sulfitobacter marinus]